MADCGYPADYGHISVIGTARTFPIRVAHRYDDDGNKIGDSGPHYFDQREVTWEDIGVEPEYTTVTNLKRRVFTFSYQQIRDAVRMCGCDSLFLNFCNYLSPKEVQEMIAKLKDGYSIDVGYLGYGPHKNDIQDIT